MLKYQLVSRLISFYFATILTILCQKKQLLKKLFIVDLTEVNIFTILFIFGILSKHQEIAIYRSFLHELRCCLKHQLEPFRHEIGSPHDHLELGQNLKSFQILLKHCIFMKKTYKCQYTPLPFPQQILNYSQNILL